MPRHRKSSACVTLVLIGAAALSGCGGDTPPGRRASYASREACLADWGEAKECDEQPRSGGGVRAWGPSYGTWHSYSSGRSSSGSSGSYGSGSSSSSGSHSVSRGGFGSHGSSSS